MQLVYFILFVGATFANKIELESDCYIPTIEDGDIVVFPMFPLPAEMEMIAGNIPAKVAHGVVVAIECHDGFITIDPIDNEFECMNGEFMNGHLMQCVTKRGDPADSKRELSYVHYGRTIKSGKEIAEMDRFIDDDGTNYFFEDDNMFRSVDFTSELLNEFYDAIEGGDFDTVVRMVNQSHGLLREKDPKTNRTAVMSAVYASNADMLEFFINQGADIQRDYSLLVASQIGYAPVIEQLIWTHARSEIRDPIRGRTPLMWAASLGHTEAVKILVDHGADVRAATDTGDFEDHEDGTAIHLAIINQHLATVQALLDSKPFLVDVKNRFSETPLMSAAYHGRINIAGRLIKYHNAPMEAHSVYGKTALMVAANNNQLAVVKLLARNGANLTARSFNMRTPLHQVVDRHLTRIVHYLVSASPKLIEEGDQQNNTALHLCVDSEYLDYIDYFTTKNPNCIPIAGYRGRTAVHVAAADGYLAAMDMMIDRYPSVVWSKSYDIDGGYMPIHAATLNAQLEIVKRLTEVNHLQFEAKTGMDDQTPLELAAHYNDVPIVCWLAENGANMEEKDESGRTSLIVAAKLNFIDVIKCLVENGANMQAKTSLHYDGITALHAAAENNSLEAIRYLVQEDKELLEMQDSFGRTPFIHAVMSRQFKAASLLIELRCNREAKTYKNETALWIASSVGDKEMVMFLHRHGCDIDSVGIYGRTPFLAAAAAGHLEVVKYLVGHGAQWSATSYYIDGSNTALHLAKYFKHYETAKWIEDTLPDLKNQKNAYGMTPVEYAASEYAEVKAHSRH